MVTDAVFSVIGDLAPVAGLHALARTYGALLLVDEAHSFGVLGEGGRGAGHDAGLAAEPDLVRTVTLSKSLSGQGGAVLGAPEVRQTLIDTGRGFIFDTGLAPPAAGAALAALGHPARQPGAARRTRCRRRSGWPRSRPMLGLTATSRRPPSRRSSSAIRGSRWPRRQTCAEHGVQRRLLPAAVRSGGRSVPAAHRKSHTDGN